jgi:hypothetical protein
MAAKGNSADDPVKAPEAWRFFRAALKIILIGTAGAPLAVPIAFLHTKNTMALACMAGNFMVVPCC